MFSKELLVGNIRLSANIFMAPMVSYTPYPFRLLCQELGAGLAFTEMVSSNALKYQDDSNQRLLFTTPKEKIKAVQLLGSQPSLMEKAACSQLLEPFDLIDINMGCPVPNVIKSGEGCGLMSDLKRASKMIAGCKKSGKPVSVKFRTGMKRSELRTAEFARMCENAGADMLTIHGRSRDMMYGGLPFYDEIREAKAVVNIPVIANGGIDSYQKAKDVLLHTNADGVMIAQYALENPFIFSQFTGQQTIKTKYDLMLFLLRETAQYYDENYTLTYLKRMASFFMKKLPDTKQYKQHLHACGNLTELSMVLQQIFDRKDGAYE